MEREFTIRICGEAGQGMQTIGQALCLIYKSAGLNVFANQDYMSRVRGGNNFFQLRVANKPLYTLRANADIVVALDKPSVRMHGPAVSRKGILVLDRKKFGIQEEDKKFFDLPLFDIAANAGGSDIFINSVACGALSALTGLEFSHVEKVVRIIFSDKSKEVIAKNLQAAHEGYGYAESSAKKGFLQIIAREAGGPLLMNGNDAIALGAIRAGCKFYSAYPMTPSTSIMNVIAHYAPQFNIIVEQAEDEIAAVNMALGASFAGARAMTGTSGGGFCLMAEGLSLAGMTETPVVIVDAQRPAPATGFPTRTEQADLDFVIHAGHGEFARLVYAPGTIEEAFYLTVKAFDLAEKYQVPALILTDQHLADSYRNINGFDMKKAAAQRHIVSREDSLKIADYKRYQLTASGISPRALPSWINGVIYVDSDEHTEEGHITEDAQVRKAMVEKRFHKKMKLLRRELVRPVVSGVKGADILLIGFGSVYGVLREAAEASGKRVGFIHLPQLWPFPRKQIEALLQGAKKTFTVENNASAQLARLIRRETGYTVTGSILKFDGRPFDLDLLLGRMRKA